MRWFNFYRQSLCCLSFLLLAFALPATGAAQQDTQKNTQKNSGPKGWTKTEKNQYDACTKMAWRAPRQAFEQALAWASNGGGDLAQRCVALALYAQKKYDHAGHRWETLARESTRADLYERAGIIAQAAQSWQLHGDVERARALMDQAIEMAPDALTLYIDRATMLGEIGLFKLAEQDLSYVLSKQPDNVEALIYRATSYRYLDQFDLAFKDISNAVLQNPDNPDALFERATIYRLTGQNDKARQDWIQVIVLSPHTPVADLAQRNLEKLDLSGAQN